MTRARDLSNLIGSGNYSSTTFTATAGQTAFTISHTQGFVQVFMNGLLLDETVDYTSNGTAITLTSGAAAGDEIEVVKYDTFSVGDAITQTAADARYELDGAENRFVGVNGTTVTTSSNSFAQVKQGVPSTGYAELQILNDIDQRVILGSIGSTYANNDWAGSRYLYSSHGDLLVKASSELELFSGGMTVGSHLSQKMNANGHITTPRNPAFNVRAQVNQTLGSSWQKIGYNHTLTQRGGSNYSTTNARFTAPVAGYYQFNATWTANTNADTDGTMTFWINGAVPTNGGTVSIPTTSPHYDGHAMSACFPLSASDYVEVYRYSTVSTTSRNGDWMGYFSGFLIG